MKHGRKPTIKQKKLMQYYNLNSADWLVVKDTPDEMVIVHRYSGHTTRTLPKGVII